MGGSFADRRSGPRQQPHSCRGLTKRSDAQVGGDHRGHRRRRGEESAHVLLAYFSFALRVLLTNGMWRYHHFDRHAVHIGVHRSHQLPVVLLQSRGSS